jgi:hypothetical protein
MKSTAKNEMGAVTMAAGMNNIPITNIMSAGGAVACASSTPVAVIDRTRTQTPVSVATLQAKIALMGVEGISPLQLR